MLATDISPRILARAQAHARAAGLAQVHTRVADAEALDVPAASFDAVICRLGLMFLPAPARGLAAMHAALRPGGGICTVVFGAPERNPCVGLLMATALRHAGLPPRDPFQPGGLLSLGQPARLEALFREAGFRDVATTAMQADFALPSARHYLAFVQASAGPIRQIVGALPPPRAQAAWDELEQLLHRFDTPDGWRGPNELLLTAARR